MEPAYSPTSPSAETLLLPSEQNCCSCNLTSIIYKVACVAVALICFKLNFYVTVAGFLVGIATINPNDPENVVNRIIKIWNHNFSSSWMAQTCGILLTATFTFYFFPWSLVTALFSAGAYAGYCVSAEANRPVAN